MVKRAMFKDYNETSLKRIIDEQSIAWNEERLAARGPKSRTLYASDYGACMLKIWRQFFPEEFPTGELDSRTMRIFHNGEDVHRRLSGYLGKASGIWFKEEVDVPRDGLEVHGRCDGICTVDERAVVVEFKSINQRSVQQPKEEHVGQLTWYMAMWRKARKELKEDFGFAEDAFVVESECEGIESASGRSIADLSEVERWLLLTQGEIVGEIVYESKQTNETHHFLVEWDARRYERVRLWFEQLKWHVENKIAPSVRYERSRYPCSWGMGGSVGRCPYYEQCWGDE